MRRTIFAAVAVTPLFLFAVPAKADIGGAHVVFVGDAHLPTFPCSTACNGSFTATVAGGPIVTVLGVGRITGLTASFTYMETCTGGQAITGSASGIATLTGENITGSPLPVDVPFQWTRVGTKAVITNSGDPIVFGTATFAAEGGAPACSGGAVTATVAGAACILWRS